MNNLAQNQDLSNNVRADAKDAALFWAWLEADREQIAICRMWIRRFATQTRHMSRARDSYAYKHAVERWFEAQFRHVYISSTAFIAAAIAEGYRALPTTDSKAVFNMSVRAPKQSLLKRGGEAVESVPLPDLARELEAILGVPS